VPFSDEQKSQKCRFQARRGRETLQTCYHGCLLNPVVRCFDVRCYCFFFFLKKKKKKKKKVAVRGAGETPPFGTNVEDAQPSQLNVAQSGDRIEHLLSKVSLPRLNMSQFDILNFVMPQDLRSEWKLVNIMIGPNDVCSYCPDSGGPATGASGQQYLAEMRKVLAAFSSSFDYALVHVLPPFNVTLISQFSDVRCAVFLGSDCLLSVDICRIVHQSVCSCITSEGGRAEVNNQLAIIYDGLQNVVDEANAALNRSTIRFFYHPFLTKVGLSQSELQVSFFFVISFCFLICLAESDGG
jgi:hypothetical protein